MTDINAETWVSSSHRPMGFPEFVAVIASIMALNPLAMDMMLPALPNIASAFHITIANRPQAVLSTFLIGFGVGQFIMGPLSDRFGRRAVLIDGMAARSCVIPIEGCEGRKIVTLEGLGSREKPDPVQQAFIAGQAAQCGYCLNGMIMTTKALLTINPRPSEAEIAEALRYNLCRCGAHLEIMRAALRAAGQIVEVAD